MSFAATPSHTRASVGGRSAPRQRALGGPVTQWLIVIVALAVGLAGSWAYTVHVPRLYASTAVVRVYNPYRVSGSQFGQVDPTAIVALELNYATSSTVTRAARSQLDQSRVGYDHISWRPLTSQDSLSLTCYAGVASNSVDCAQSFAQQYVDSRRTAAVSALNAQVDDIQREVTHLDRLVAGLPGGGAAAAPSKADVAQQTAYLARISSLTDDAQNLKMQAATLAQNYEVAKPPTFPHSIATPAVRRDLAIGGLAGLLVGVGLVLAIRERRDRRIRQSAS